VLWLCQLDADATVTLFGRCLMNFNGLWAMVQIYQFSERKRPWFPSQSR